MYTQHKNRKNFYQYLCLLLVFVYACKKSDVIDNVRLFRPVAKEKLLSDGNWISASWQSIKGAVGYEAQVSRDTFRTIDVTVNVDSSSVLIENLQWNQLYQVRVRALAQDTVYNSRLSELGAIKTAKFPTILKSATADDITDVAIRVSWENSGATVTSIKVYNLSDSSLVKEVPLTDQDVTNQYKIIEALTPSTTYIIYLYSGTTLRGWDNYTTKATFAGELIDLRNIVDNPNILYDTLPDIPSGSTVLLKRGLTYSIPSTYTFDKTVAIMSGQGFEEPARIALKGNFDAVGNIDSLRFADLIITKAGANYFMNVGKVAKIGKVAFENIKTEGVFDNSFVRLKTAGDEITTLYINNCIIDSFGISARYPVIFANASSSAKIDNIEVHNSTFYSFYYFIRQDGVTTTSAIINNCTYNELINQNGYFINYSTFPATFTISNTIFGKTIDEKSSNWIKASGNPSLGNCYSTSDCKFSANAITGTTAYPNPAADLFTDPAMGDFKIKDNTFDGKNDSGDPRWRP